MTITRKYPRKRFYFTDFFIKFLGSEQSVQDSIECVEILLSKMKHRDSGEWRTLCPTWRIYRRTIGSECHNVIVKIPLDNLFWHTHSHLLN